MPNSFFGWFQKKPQTTASAHVDELFLFLRGMVNREDLIADIWQQYGRVSTLPPRDQEAGYIGAYLKLEEFIVTNKPLVVKEELTRGALRTVVFETLNIRQLSPLFQLFFLPEKERLLSLFHLAAKGLIQQIVRMSGDQKLQDMAENALKKDSVISLRITEDVVAYASAPDQATASQIETAFQRLYRMLYDEVVAVTGQDAAAGLVKEAYEYIGKTQSIDMLTAFFAYMPEGILVSERFSYLSKEELATKVAQATIEEKKKKEEAQNLATQLAGKVRELENQYETTEETKQAMLNLLEDARELEATLKVERDRATAIVSSMGEGLYVVDAQYRVLLVNRVAEELFGLAPGSAVGKKLSEITTIYKDDKELPETERALYKTIHSGEPISVTMEDNYTIRSPQGKTPIVFSTAALKRDGVVTGGLVTFHDVTKDKEVKKTIEHTVDERTRELKQEQAKLTASINSLDVGFIITDQDGAIITKNPAVERILGITHTAVNLDDIEKQLAGVIKFRERYEKVQTDKKSAKIKDILLGAKHLELFFAPIFLTGTQGDFLGTVILVQDITEAKVLERSRDEFFSIASHELRTPLTAIRGNTSMILDYFGEDLGKNAEMKEMIDDIHESSIRLINIVNDFLQTSRLEQGRLQFKNEAFDIAPLIEAALKEYEVTGSRKKLYLRYEAPPDPMPQVVGDKDRIKEVLINLVGNALKFTEEGGVTVKVILSDEYVRVVVEDTGRGIPYEYQMLLFHKFQQAGDSLFTRDTTKGTGLGLYISKLLVEGMGGTIGLQYSSPGKGSAFGFALPIVGSAHAARLNNIKSDEGSDSNNLPVANSEKSI